MENVSPRDDDDEDDVGSFWIRDKRIARSVGGEGDIDLYDRASIKAEANVDNNEIDETSNDEKRSDKQTVIQISRGGIDLITRPTFDVRPSVGE